MNDDRGMRVAGGIAQTPTSEAQPARPAGRRLEWPTIWHPDQLPFPWGSAKRLRKGSKAAEAPISQRTDKP